MCGLVFSMTRRSQDDSAPVEAPDALPSDRRTPTHARVDSIMGVPSSYSAHNRTTAVKAANKKRRTVSNLNNNDLHKPISATYQSSRYSSLDQITMGKRPMVRRSSMYQLHPRPRLSERRRIASSPLVNVVVPEELKLEEDGESGYESATKNLQDEKSLHFVAGDSPDKWPKPMSDTTERIDFANPPSSFSAPMEPSYPRAVHASNKNSAVPTDSSTAHARAYALARIPKVIQNSRPTDVGPRGNFL